MRTQSQYTIYSLNEVYAGTTAPTSQYKGELWVDTSQTNLINIDICLTCFKKKYLTKMELIRFSSIMEKK